MTIDATNGRPAESAWLAWLSRMRVLVITVLLGIELAIIQFAPTAVPVRLFVVVIVLWYTIAALFALLYRHWDDHRLQARIQVISDLVFATLLVYYTGGIDSSLNFLYPLVIIVAAMMLPRYWTFIVALLSFISFGLVVELSYFEVIHSYSLSLIEPKTLQVTILLNLFGYLAIAYLASYLAQRLRQVRAQFEQQRAALEELRVLHAAIVNSTTNGLITVDLNGRITLMNPAAQRLFENHHHQWVGEHIGTILGPDVADSGRFEIRRTSAADKERVFGVTVSSLTSGDADGLLYTIDDLSEIRRLEREIRTRDRMAAIGRMAAGITHEIRNPLTSIAGSAMMLRECAQLDSEQRTLMEIIVRESERLNNIVGDFLAYSRDKDFRFDQHDLVPLLEDTLRLLENVPEVQQGIVRVIRQIDVEIAPAVVDGDRIKQVFWNICHNAVRAMERNGGALRVSLSASGTDWRINFSDEGPGLSEKQQEKIFEPFQSGFAGGTGLGLAIVYQIVQAHEGKIEVNSELGKGMEFVLLLARSNAHGAGAAAGILHG